MLDVPIQSLLPWAHHLATGGLGSAGQRLLGGMTPLKCHGSLLLA
jgi:hypothetical protein